MNKLTKYNELRNFNKTPEPQAKKEKQHQKLIFIVQYHISRKEHYDFRLELDGVLISFAIPKGPSYNIKDKRLAIKVEDHPLSYRNFEGTIPVGEYGAGTVMLWDLGYWIPESNPKTSLKKGLLKFELKGKRLKGKWTLINIEENNWLLIKEKDNIKTYDNILEFNTSIKTGRTMEEISKNINIKKNQDIIVEGIKITNPNKVISTNPKITKLDIVLYYKAIWKYIKPYLNNRIISTIRYPTSGKPFFKKHFNNKYLGKINIPTKNNKTDYYYIKNLKGLIEEVQMNGYEFHISNSKITDPNHPDYMVFDLDPDEELPIKKLRDGVRDLKSILDDLKLESFLKTSGKKGYHILVYFKNTPSKEFIKISENIAKLMTIKWPNKYTTSIKKEDRQGKIFIDYLRNTKKATSVAPYSLRIGKKITVSMPIEWNELNHIKPNSITLKEALKRLK